jgi:hypothetical protein
MSNFIKKVEHPETGECVEAEFLDDYFGKHNYGLRLPDGRVFGEGCLAICKTEEGKYEGTELLTGHIHQKGKMVEPQEKSVVEYDKLSLRGEIVKMVANQLHNIVNLDKIEPVIDDIEQFILDLQKETDDKWKRKIEEVYKKINELKEDVELNSAGTEYENPKNCGCITGEGTCDECIKLEVNQALDQATNIIKELVK